MRFATLILIPLLVPIINLVATPEMRTAIPEIPTRQTTADEQTRAHTAWVESSLKAMQTVKPGMTRGQLLKVFAEEGGLSTGLRRTYAYRECPLFKVDVEFTPAGRPARDSAGRVTLIESEADVIKTISRPYLGWPVAD